MPDRRTAEAFPPGEFIKEELEARGWSQVELAEIIGCLPKVVNDLIMGRKAITPAIAKALADAFGTGAQYWMNVQSIYQLWRSEEVDNAIARRSRLYQLAPIKEMVRRHWLEPSESIEVLEERVKGFYGIQRLDHPIEFRHAARRGTRELSPSQMAWLHRARQLACAVHARPFTAQSFRDGMDELKGLLHSEQETRHVPKVLAQAGIRFLILEHLPHTRIDGVAFWLDERSPVIALSLRYDRVDAFWYTLAHELGHVARRDRLRRQVVLDTDIVGDQVEPAENDAEKQADSFAVEFLVKQSELEDFIVRVRPLYGRQKILGFANRMKVHPGIIVGQLQFRKEIPWSSFRQMLNKVRHVVSQSALTDGWGQVPPVLS